METEQPSSLAVLLTQTRRHAELTQEGLAERAGVSVNTISNLEAGRGHLPRQATLDLLLGALLEALALEAPEAQVLRASFHAALGVSRASRKVADSAVPPQDAPTPPPLATGILTVLVCLPLREAGEQHSFLLHLITLLQQIMPQHGGRLVDAPDGPDGAVCVFTQAGAAVRAACALDAALRDWAAAQVGGVPARLALHTGWAAAGTGEYAGPTRRRAVRLGWLGQGGQLLLTQATRELLRESPPEGMRVAMLGQHNLSVVERPQPVFALVPSLLLATAPSLRQNRCRRPIFRCS